MRDIGGYFELETLYGKAYHKDLIALNSARNALIYLLRAQGLQKIYLPYLLCDCVENICRDYHIDISFYHINAQFLPEFYETVGIGEVLYVVNFYGQLDNATLKALAQKYGKIIVDNTHAFFQRPIPGIDTIYSCRKFFGVPDGAYLQTDHILDMPLDDDFVSGRMAHLLGRFEGLASDYYDDYKQNDHIFDSLPLRKMSGITQNILQAVDYTVVAQRRSENFRFLHSILNQRNRLQIVPPEVPFAYPFYCENGLEIRRKLAEKRIYVPTLWPNVLDLDTNSLEWDYAANILPLPCDQRYDQQDMDIILSALNEIGDGLH